MPMLELESPWMITYNSGENMANRNSHILGVVPGNVPESLIAKKIASAKIAKYKNDTTVLKLFAELFASLLLVILQIHGNSDILYLPS